MNLLQEKACDSLYSRLVTVLRSLDKAGLAAQNEQSLLGQIEAAYLKQQPGSASLKAFRRDLGALGSDLVDAVATGIPDRPAFIRKLLDVFVRSDEAREVLALAFDDAGVTSLFEDWGRFRKVYTPKRAMAAARSLLGWLYEASSFNRTELQKAPNQDFQAREFVSDDGKNMNYGVVIAEGLENARLADRIAGFARDSGIAPDAYKKQQH